VKQTQLQMNLPGVPKAKQGREVAPQWEWTEASVWTERMLAALERGVKGSKWFSLMDKVWKMENLQSAMRQVVRNQGAAGVDGQSCEAYLKASPERLPRLQEILKQGTYRPKPVKRVWIPKLGSKELRPLGVPTVEARVVETALRNVLEPIFEHICRTQLRFQTPPWSQAGFAKSGSAAQDGAPLGGRCRPQRLL